ncbi:hypothetical protein ILYODFUR_010262 [Ilyodon furcidens]|uniref:Uncharacterized protein n=1 Tax=Ilyodon furcidens TaxID=33524 RepID=A0ABV0VG03_9TELE
MEAESRVERACVKAEEVMGKLKIWGVSSFGGRSLLIFGLLQTSRHKADSRATSQDEMLDKSHPCLLDNPSQQSCITHHRHCFLSQKRRISNNVKSPHCSDKQEL